MKFFLAITFCLLGKLNQVLSATLASPTTIDKYPFQVSLQVLYEGEYRHICGGTIVSKDCIVTAAHCKDTKYDYQVVAGITKLSDLTGAQISKINKFTVHDQYNPDTVGTNDIGIIKLDKPLDLNQIKVKAIDLPAKNQNFIGSQTIVTGWGSVSFVINPLISIGSDQLRELNQWIVPNAVCSIGGTAEDTDVCGQGLGGSACNGDSGGPLSKGNVLVGVVSRGIPACAATATTYTNAAAFVDYIEEQCGM